MASKLIAVVAGVGPGTSAAVVRKFAATYPIALLARNPDNYNPLVEEITKAGGKAIGVQTDVSSESSVKSAFEKIKGELGDAGIAVSHYDRY
jgi:NAD(P)-dependent dehydrogenase (short-subunit alcohol dehydrogenase family)